MEKYVLGLELEPILNGKKQSKKSKDESCGVCHCPPYNIASKPKFEERIKEDNRAQNIARVRWRKSAAIFNYHHEAMSLCYLNQRVLESTQRWSIGSTNGSILPSNPSSTIHQEEEFTNLPNLKTIRIDRVDIEQKSEVKYLVPIYPK